MCAVFVVLNFSGPGSFGCIRYAEALCLCCMYFDAVFYPMNLGQVINLQDWLCWWFYSDDSFVLSVLVLRLSGFISECYTNFHLMQVFLFLNAVFYLFSIFSDHVTTWWLRWKV